MALVSIILRDEPDGRVDITLNSEPSLDLTDDGVLSDAQIVALNMLNDAVGDGEGVNVKASA